MNLYDMARDRALETGSPLAARMRPKTLEEFVGQEHIVAPGKLLWRAIKADKLTSAVFYGPPGTGKTTLAAIIANATKSAFVRLNATTAGVKDIKAVADEANGLLALGGRRTTLFIDEIHRFNKAQQDALLPHVEDGTLVLIGATTENPFFEVNKALVSRSIIFELHPLSAEAIRALLERAVTDERGGFGKLPLEISAEALAFLAEAAGGDARNAYNALELAVLTTRPDDAGVIRVGLDEASECIQKKHVVYDSGDSHYDVVSAFIKSMRGSDPDAAVYYLARMIYAGEDPEFIARRIVICAAEDVGNADPMALVVAASAAEAARFVGFPEAQIPLSQAVLYVASAPKSNCAVMAVTSARSDVVGVNISGVPRHLRDAHYPGSVRLGNGIGYKYAHDYPGNYVPQQYLPDELAGRIYYNPTENGAEKAIKERLERLRGQG
ncbi:MAG: replication-associated recombination protein A [Clostridiales bacterium]|jgi:putative ATPase|nr:replication-associated recombination protein A [Clostridiales bacterium]